MFLVLYEWVGLVKLLLSNLFLLHLALNTVKESLNIVNVFQVCHMFRGCKSEDMPPHIYSVAQSAYETVISTRHDGSIVFMGPAGSGKTTNYRHTLHYMALIAGHQNKVALVNTTFPKMAQPKMQIWRLMNLEAKVEV